MRRRLLCSLALSMLVLGTARGQVDITLLDLQLPYSDSRGIDYHSPTNTLMLSIFAQSGDPFNFARMSAAGTVFRQSAASGIPGDLIVATVRPGNLGGFNTGDTFASNGSNGIVRVSSDGATFDMGFSRFLSGTEVVRGVHIDETGAFGGELLATTNHGRIFRIASTGNATLVGATGASLQDLTTVPNDPARYGILAGRVLTSGSGTSTVFAVNAAGDVFQLAAPIAIEGYEMVRANENFYGIDVLNSTFLGAAAADFASMAGDILISADSSSAGESGLWRLQYSGSGYTFSQLTLEAGSSADARVWEGITFAPLSIGPIPPIAAPIPEPETYAMLLAGLALLGFESRRRRKLQRTAA